MKSSHTVSPIHHLNCILYVIERLDFFLNILAACSKSSFSKLIRVLILNDKMNNLKTLNEKIKFYTPQLKRRRNKNAEESCDDFRCKDYTHTNLGNHLETLRVSVEKKNS